MNSWFEKFEKFVSNVLIVDSLRKKYKHVLLGGMDIEGSSNEKNVRQISKEKEKNMKRKTHSKGFRLQWASNFF